MAVVRRRGTGADRRRGHDRVACGAARSYLCAVTDDAARDALNTALSGRYTIIRELGRGGMATVFLARDVRHSREVAVKVMQRDVVAPNGAERFLHEIGFAARLTHPHVLGMHDSGETDGLLYYVMPFVDGETLRARIARDGALPLPDATRLMRELAGALAYAHAQGVVHRDLKPENVLLSAGHAVVADFGIAKAVADGTHAGSTDSAKLTGTGVSIGTPAYMAPEQAVGDKTADHRADLYALGVIAYEMISGAHPFGERSAQALVAAHLTETPAPLAARRTDVPPTLDALVSTLLAKNPAERLQSAGEVVHALDAMTAGSPVTVVRPAHRTRAIIAVLIVLAASVLYMTLFRPPANGAPKIRMLAVLPFVNVSGVAADEFLSDGLRDELANALVSIPGLGIAGRTSTYAYKGKGLPAPELGRALQSDALIEGTVQRSGDRLRVTVQLVNAADGRVLMNSSHETQATEEFRLEEEFTHAVVIALAPSLGGGAANAPVVKIDPGTKDLDAYQFYLQGEHAWHERGATNVTNSIGYFKRAIARDPNFARAYAGLALAYNTLPTYVPDPKDSVPALMSASAARAVQLDSMLADAQVAVAVSEKTGEGRAAEASAHFRKAIAIDPANEYAHHAFGFFLMGQGNTDEAIREGERSVQLDPLALSAGTALALELAFARRDTESLTAAGRVRGIDSTFALAYETMGIALVLGGHPDSAVRALERARTLSPRLPGLPSKFLFAYAAAGRWADAEKLRDELHRPNADNTGGLDAAYADLIFGDREPLLRLFETAAGRSRWQQQYLFGCNPALDPLRSDARFQAAMKLIEVEPCNPVNPWRIPPRR